MSELPGTIHHPKKGGISDPHNPIRPIDQAVSLGESSSPHLLAPDSVYEDARKFLLPESIEDSIRVQPRNKLPAYLKKGGGQVGILYFLLFFSLIIHFLFFGDMDLVAIYAIFQIPLLFLIALVVYQIFTSHKMKFKHEMADPLNIFLLTNYAILVSPWLFLPQNSSHFNSNLFLFLIILTVPIFMIGETTQVWLRGLRDRGEDLKSQEISTSIFILLSVTILFILFSFVLILLANSELFIFFTVVIDSVIIIGWFAYLEKRYWKILLVAGQRSHYFFRVERKLILSLIIFEMLSSYSYFIDMNASQFW